MATLLFKLNNVPEDEAEDVRQLLAVHEIPTHETHAGFWGLGVSAIWLRDKSRLEEARALIDEYQKERAQQQREEFREREARGEVPSMGRRLLNNPLRFLALIVAIIVVLAVTLLPFWGMLAWD